MEHEIYDAAACSACDLGARLQGELAQAREALQRAELRFHAFAMLIEAGVQDAPFAARRALITARQRVDALERVLDGVLGIHGVGECHAASA
jgi:hypothetical protein